MGKSLLSCFFETQCSSSGCSCCCCCSLSSVRCWFTSVYTLLSTVWAVYRTRHPTSDCGRSASLMPVCLPTLFVVHLNHLRLLCFLYEKLWPCQWKSCQLLHNCRNKLYKKSTTNQSSGVKRVTGNRRVKLCINILVQQACPSTSFVDSAIDLRWQNFQSPEFGAKFQMEVPLFPELPRFPYNTA